MNRGQRIGLGLLVVAALLITIGCSRLLDYWGPKHPDPPAGVFPPRVGKMQLDSKEMNPGCTRGDPLHCWGDYVDSAGDRALSLISYWVDIYDSRDHANAAFEALPAQRISEYETITSWEDRVNKEGQKIGKVLLRNTIRQDNDLMIGYCSLSYIKEEMVISIVHGYECDSAREFLKDLTAITD